MSENKEVQNGQELSDKEIEEALNDIRETIDGKGEDPNTDVLELTDVVEGEQAAGEGQADKADQQAATADGDATQQEESAGSRHNDLMDEPTDSIDEKAIDAAVAEEEKSKESLNEPEQQQNPAAEEAPAVEAESAPQDSATADATEDAGEEQAEEIKDEAAAEPAGEGGSEGAGAETTGGGAAADDGEMKSAAVAKMSDIADNVQNVVAENEKRDNLLDENTASESKDALRDIVKMANKPNVNSVKFRSGTSIEDIVSEIMRPMLQEWLNDNLAELVKKTVEREIRRLVPQEDEE
jgi:cell pole-organizing protein PopZ